MMNNIINQTLTESKTGLFIGITPAHSEALAFAGRWPECKERALRAADTLDAGQVNRLGRNAYRVRDLDTNETHTVTFATFNETGGYSCDCPDWWRGLISLEGAPYPYDWSGCSPMCVHVLAVDMGLRVEAVEAEAIPW